MSTGTGKELFRSAVRQVHDDDIRSDLFNILITDFPAFVTAEKRFPFRSYRHDHLTDTARTLVKFKIRNIPQLPAVSQIDHILAFQLGKQHFTSPSILFLCNRICKKGGNVPLPSFFIVYFVIL